jgi:dihydropteroate synthase
VQIVGVLNVTPDSFHDGGRYIDPEAALLQAEAILREGADYLEIGGESTGPNSSDIPAEEELRRIVPVIDAVRRKFPAAKVAVDTHKVPVAREVLRKGVLMINDVTAGRGDPGLFEVVRDAGAMLVLMYAKDESPRTTVKNVAYPDVVRTIRDFLADRKGTALKAGISEERIILDPGLGHFISSDPAYSLQILARLREFLSLGGPVLVSPSRKSFLAGSEQLKTVDRLPGTIAASAIAVLNGASFVRTHDIEPVRRACEIAAAIRGATSTSQ